MSKRRHDGEDGMADGLAKVQRGDLQARKQRLKAFVTGLNAQFASWIQQQLAQHPSEPWASGVQDYIEHLEDLKRGFKDVLESADTPTAAPPPAVPSGLFGGPRPSSDAAAAAAPSSAFGFSNGAGPSPPSSRPFASLAPAFGSSAPAFGSGAPAGATSTSNFGAAPAFGTVTTSGAGDAGKRPELFGFGAKDTGAATAAASAAPAAAATSRPPPSSSVSFSFGAKPAAAASDGVTTSSSVAGTRTSALATAAPSTSSGTMFSFGAKPVDAAATAASTASTPASAPALFSFGGGAAAGSTTAVPSSSSAAGAASSAPAFSFGSKPAFSFGAPAAPAGADKEGPPAAAASASAAGAAAPFSFGAAAASGASIFGSSGAAAAPAFSFQAPAANPPPAGGDGDGDGDGEPENEQNEFNKEPMALKVDESAAKILFKTKSKFLHQKKDEQGKVSWDNKGVGTLMVRQLQQGGKPFITFTTESGRNLFTVSIPKAMRIILNEAQNAALFSAPWAPPDSSGPPTAQSVNFRMTKGKHEEFKQVVEKVQAEMD